MSSSPSHLVTGSDSPVSRLSFTPATPQATSASAGTWSPRRRITRSPSTTSPWPISRSAPPRRTTTGRSARICRRSTMRLERTSCTMPMRVLSATTPRKARFRQVPVSATSAASARLTPLKSVSVCSATMRATGLVLGPASALTLPADTRSETSSGVRPPSSGASMGTSSGASPIASRRLPAHSLSFAIRARLPRRGPGGLAPLRRRLVQPQNVANHCTHEAGQENIKRDTTRRRAEPRDERHLGREAEGPRKTKGGICWSDIIEPARWAGRKAPLKRNPRGQTPRGFMQGRTGALCGIRTRDLLLRRQTLYPAELREQRGRSIAD